jgi:hypothetical protein
VSEVKDWILPGLVRYMMETEQSLQQMMERLLAKQTEEMKAGQQVVQARYSKADAEVKARQE